MQDLLKKLLFGNAGGSNGGAPSLNLSFVDGGTFDPRITFSRGTNATLTGSNGLIQYAPHNLLTNSEDFEASGWIKSGTTVTANPQVAPDGTTTADTVVLVNGGTSDTIGQPTNITATNHVFSCFLRAGTATAVQIGFLEQGVGGFYVNVNLSNGTFGTPPAGLTALSIDNFGNGWWRVAVSRVFTAAASNHIPRVTGGTGTTAGQSFFIWGAQLNVGALQTYYPTTPKNLLGFTQEPENAAWTKSNSYVQQNLLTWSQDFDNAIWSKVQLNTTGTPAWVNVTTAPDGSTTTDKFIATNVASDHTAVRTDVTGANTYTLSVFAKASEYSFLALWLFQATTVKGVLFDISNGTFVSHLDSGNQVTSYAVTPVGNGYFRLTITATLTLAQCGFSISNSATPSFTASRLPTFTGDGTSGVFIWGAQLVQGADAGQYTQTTSAAAVTRYTNWDGTLTGRKLVENTGVGVEHFVLAANVSIGAANTLCTSTVYVKAAEITRLQMRAYSGGSPIAQASFNLSTLQFSSISAGTWAYQDAGGGWYRISVVATHTNTSSNGIGVFLINSAGALSYTGDGTSGIYVSDFQLSNSASVDPYVYNPQAAAASAAFYGPRIDYDPVTLASRGLLIEEQRTNLLTYSEAASTSPWGLTNITASVDTAVAPDGATTADTLTEGVGAQIQFANTQVQTIVSGQTVTLSRYVKRGTGVLRGFRLECEGGANGFRANFNPDTGAVSSSSAFGAGVVLSSGSEPAANGFRRYYVTGTLGTSTSITNYFRFTETPTSPNIGYTGDGIQSFVVWGAQLEAGAFATSYIPTVASQVTRNADSASMLGDNFYTWYNPNQGTLYAEANGLSTAGTRILGIGPGPSNLMYLTLVQNAIVANGTLQASFAFTPATNTAYKTAMAYKANDFASSYSGSIATDVSGSVPVGMTTATIGWVDSAGAFVGSGTIRSIRYYTVRLPDATLQQITS